MDNSEVSQLGKVENQSVRLQPQEHFAIPANQACRKCQELFQHYRQELLSFQHLMCDLERKIFEIQLEQLPLLKEAGATKMQMDSLARLPRLARQFHHYGVNTLRWLPMIAPEGKCMPLGIAELREKIKSCAREMDWVITGDAGIDNIVKNLLKSTTQLKKLNESELALLTYKAKRVSLLAKQVNEVLESIRWRGWYSDVWQLELNGQEPLTKTTMERLADLLPRTAPPQEIDRFIQGLMKKMRRELKSAAQMFSPNASKMSIEELASLVVWQSGSKAIQELIDLVVERGVSCALFMAGRVPQQAASLKEYMKEHLLVLIQGIDSVDPTAKVRNLESLINVCFFKKEFSSKR